jgi:hypothetical protein
MLEATVTFQNGYTGLVCRLKALLPSKTSHQSWCEPFLLILTQFFVPI